MLLYQKYCHKVRTCIYPRILIPYTTKETHFSTLWLETHLRCLRLMRGRAGKQCRQASQWLLLRGCCPYCRPDAFIFLLFLWIHNTEQLPPKLPHTFCLEVERDPKDLQLPLSPSQWITHLTWDYALPWTRLVARRRGSSLMNVVYKCDLINTTLDTQNCCLLLV